MITVQRVTIECACCGEPSTQALVSCGNEFGARDLDHRPAETRRSTMDGWLQECPHCGYVGRELTTADERDRLLVRRDEYQLLRDGPYISRVSGRFLLRAVIDAGRGDRKQAFANTLCAAWDADDRGLDQAARALRRRAAAYLSRHCDDLGDLELRLLDVLRRAADWDKARLLAGRLASQSLDHQAAAILSFQVGRIEARDDRAYTVVHALSGDLAVERRLRLLR